MRIIYMGTPQFAVPPLERLIHSRHEVCLVVTQQDKARGRGKKIQFPPVKELAVKHEIPVLQPERVKGNDGFLEEIASYQPDCIVVAAYGQILPKAFLEIPKFGCINIHASLLPKYRGAAPIQWCIIDGEAKTGVTIMEIEEALDAGDMILKAETPVERKNYKTLHDELSIMGADLLLDALDLIETGKAVKEKQNDDFSCYAPMIRKEDGHIDFSQSAEEIARLIRGIDCYCLYQDEKMKLIEAEVLKQESLGKVPGSVCCVSTEGIDIVTGNGILRLIKIQMPGKKPVAVSDYLRGNSFDEHAVLG